MHEMLYPLALREIVALQDASHRVMRRQAHDVDIRHRRQPLAVEADLGFLFIENLEHLRFVGFGVLEDRFARHGRARHVAAGGVADQPGHIADEKNHRVAEVLKVFHLAQQHGVAQVQVRCGRIEADFDAQFAAGFGGCGQPLAEILFANDLHHAFPQVG